MRLLPRLTGLWRNADFVRLLAGSTISRFGSLLGALNFLAVVELDATPFQIGVLTAAGVAPGLLFGFVAGVWADRARRRPILILADVGRAVSLASLPIAFYLDILRFEHLYAVAFFNGACMTFFDVSFGAYVPSLVRRDNLMEANSKLTASESIVETSAFSAGGWIVQLFGSMVAVVIDAFTFLISALLLMSIRATESVSTSKAKPQNAPREVWEGFRFVLGNPVLRAFTGSAIAEGLQHGIVGATILIFGVRELGFETGVLATIFAIGGISSLVGASLTMKITRRFGVGPSLIVGFLMFGLATLLIPLARGPLIVAGLFLGAAQMFDGAHIVYSINEISLRQAITPDRMLGRVNASLRFVGIGMIMVGSLLGGYLAETIGLRWTLVVGAGSGLLGAIPLFLSPIRDIKETPLDG